VVLHPLQVEVLERLPLREAVLERLVGDGVGGIRRVLGHEHRALEAVHVLLDQRAAVGTQHQPRLGHELGHGVHLRVPGEPVRRIAAVVLHEHREAELLHRQRQVGLAAHDEVRGRVDVPGTADALHGLPRRLIERRVGAGERKAEPLQRLDHLHAHPSFVPGAVAEVEVEVVSSTRRLDDLRDGVVLLQRDHRPLGIREKRARVTRPVPRRERVELQVLVRQQADAHRDAWELATMLKRDGE
jgi:hypothetical protein